MQTETKFLDTPIKYAFTATMFFAVASYLTSFVLEFLAIFAVGMADRRASWDAIHVLGGFSGPGVLKYFLFYLLAFIALGCLERSPLKKSPWLALLLLGALPGLMSFMPALFAGEFHVGGSMALGAMVMGLLFLGVSPKQGTFQTRSLFLALLLAILAVDVGAIASSWFDEVHREAVAQFGADLADRKSFEIALYFVPGAIALATVRIYLVVVYPARFLRELRAQVPQA